MLQSVKQPPGPCAERKTRRAPRSLVCAAGGNARRWPNTKGGNIVVRARTSGRPPSSREASFPSPKRPRSRLRDPFAPVLPLAPLETPTPRRVTGAVECGTWGCVCRITQAEPARRCDVLRCPPTQDIPKAPGRICDTPEPYAVKRKIPPENRGDHFSALCLFAREKTFFFCDDWATSCSRLRLFTCALKTCRPLVDLTSADESAAESATRCETEERRCECSQSRTAALKEEPKIKRAPCGARAIYPRPTPLGTRARRRRTSRTEHARTCGPRRSKDWRRLALDPRASFTRHDPRTG